MAAHWLLSDPHCDDDRTAPSQVMSGLQKSQTVQPAICAESALFGHVRKQQEVSATYFLEPTLPRNLQDDGMLKNDRDPCKV